MLSESVIVCRNFLKKISRRDCPLGRFDELKISSNYAFIVYWLQAVLSYGVDVYGFRLHWLWTWGETTMFIRRNCFGFFRCVKTLVWMESLKGL